MNSYYLSNELALFLARHRHVKARDRYAGPCSAAPSRVGAARNRGVVSLSLGDAGCRAAPNTSAPAGSERGISRFSRASRSAVQSICLPAQQSSFF